MDNLAAWLQERVGREPWKSKQADIALRLDVAQSVVSRWVRGKSTPTFEYAKALARELGEPEGP